MKGLKAQESTTSSIKKLKIKQVGDGMKSTRPSARPVQQPQPQQ
jgi:hypothetical protein